MANKKRTAYDLLVIIVLMKMTKAFDMPLLRNKLPRQLSSWEQGQVFFHDFRVCSFGSSFSKYPRTSPKFDMVPKAKGGGGEGGNSCTASNSMNSMYTKKNAVARVPTYSYRRLTGCHVK
jgi:hypothetical protein